MVKEPPLSVAESERLELIGGVLPTEELENVAVSESDRLELIGGVLADELDDVVVAQG